MVEGGDLGAVGGEDAAGAREGEAGAEAVEAAEGHVEEGEREGGAAGLEEAEEGQRGVGGVGHEEARRLGGEQVPAERQGRAVGAAAGAEAEEVVEAREALRDVGDQLRRDVWPAAVVAGGGGGRIRAAVGRRHLS